MGRGDVAAARRGYSVETNRGDVAAARRGSSVETNRGDAAAVRRGYFDANGPRRTRRARRYSLRVGHHNGEPFAVATAGTGAGLAHALESFAQLVEATAGGAALRHARVHVRDWPEKPWRGLMLDVARHFLPPPALARAVDACAAAKLNVLHLHLSDSQAFPLAFERAPANALQKGAHSAAETYSEAQLRSLQRKAAARGVRVVPEVDVLLPRGSSADGSRRRRGYDVDIPWR